MHIKATGRSALILVTGLFALLLATPGYAACVEDCAGSQAASQKASPKSEATSAPLKLKKFSKKRVLGVRHATRRHRAVVASGQEKPAKAAGQAAEAAVEQPVVQIPTEVANANAQLRDMPDALAKSDPLAPAATTTDGLLQLVAADELNEVDRTAGQAETPPPAVSAAVANSRAEMRGDDSTWDKTSVIGKIFIAFGSLLTLASAARMFMA